MILKTRLISYWNTQIFTKYPNSHILWVLSIFPAASLHKNNIVGWWWNPMEILCSEINGCMMMTSYGSLVLSNEWVHDDDVLWKSFPQWWMGAWWWCPMEVFSWVMNGCMITSCWSPFLSNEWCMIMMSYGRLFPITVIDFIVMPPFQFYILQTFFITLHFMTKFLYCSI